MSHGARVRTGLKRAFFALLTLVMAATALELLARAVGGGPETFPSPLPFQSSAVVAVRQVPGGLVWPHGRLQVRARQKAGLRLMLFGESAAEGDGYTPWVAMGGVLERIVRRAVPEPVEVLNLATPGAGSRHIVPVVLQSLRTEVPDVVVMYIGNNELHELRALKKVMPGYDADLELTRRRLWRFASYRRLIGWIVPPPTRFEVDTATWPRLGSLETRADDDDRALAMLFYEESLREMLEAARRASTRVVIASVAVNERDWSDTQGTAEERALVAQARGLLTSDPAQSRELTRRSESIGSRPVRALPQTWPIVRRLAGEYGATFCDVVEALGEGQPAGLSGGEAFDDACHPNAAGHEKIGAALAGCVLEALDRPGATTVPARPDPTRLDGWAEPRGTQVPDDGSPGAALRSGNAAFVEHDLPRAARWYDAAEARGAPAGVVALNRGLLEVYRPDLEAARSGLRAAAAAFPGDVDIVGMSAALAGK